MSKSTEDMVNHPKHYEGGTSLECIDSMLAVLGHDGLMNFCLGNAYKYIWRHKLKDKPEEDLAKAKWYIDQAYGLDYGEYHDRIIGLRDLYTIYTNKLAKQDREAKEDNEDENSLESMLERLWKNATDCKNDETVKLTLDEIYTILDCIRKIQDNVNHLDSNLYTDSIIVQLSFISSIIQTATERGCDS